MKKTYIAISLSSVLSKEEYQALTSYLDNYTWGDTDASLVEVIKFIEELKQVSDNAFDDENWLVHEAIQNLAMIGIDNPDVTHIDLN